MSDLDLVVWLKRQLDEDERDADGIHRYEGGMSELTCDHIVAAGHDACTCRVPDQLRREVEAKRRILAEHLKAEYRDECRRCFDPDTAPGDYDFETFPCPTLRALALPYSDRPGYRSEWAPQ